MNNKNDKSKWYDFIILFFIICTILVSFSFYVILYYFPKFRYFFILQECFLKINVIKKYYEIIIMKIYFSLMKRIEIYYEHEILLQKSERTLNKENEENKENKENEINCFSPHGSLTSQIVFYDIGKNKLNNKITVKEFFEIPILNRILEILNFKRSDKKTIDGLLKNKESISISIGGIREGLLSNDKTEILYIKKRRGIFDLAIKTNTPLRPYYTFGLTSLYKNYIFGDFLFIPKKVKLTTYQGKSIIPKKNDTVEKLRKRYIKEVKRIFYKNRKKYFDKNGKSWKDKKLIIY